MALAPDDRSPAVIGVMTLLLCQCWTTFALRAWVRLRVIKAPGIDDLLTFAALLLFTVYGAFVFYAAHWGTGKHVTVLSPEALNHGLMGWFLAEVFYVLSTAVLKCAVGAFLLRVATEKLHRMIIWSLIGLNIAFNIYYFLSTIFQCIPVNFFWNRTDPRFRGHCINPVLTADSTYAQSALSILTDWVYGILPIFIVWHLKMNKLKRIEVALVLGLGAVASTATIIRVPYLVNLTRTEDFLFATVDVAIWSSVEPGIGITAVSLATLRPLFRIVLLRAGFSSGSEYPGPNSAAGSSGVAKAQPKTPTLPLDGAGLNNTTGNKDNIEKVYRPDNNRKSMSFLDDVSPDDVSESGVYINPVSPISTANSGNAKGVAFSRSPMSSLKDVNERPEFDGSGKTGRVSFAELPLEGNFMLPQNAKQNTSLHRNFSRPQSSRRGRGASFGAARPPTGQSVQSENEDVSHVQQPDEFSWV